MKWYWIVLIVVISVAIGYWYKKTQDTNNAIQKEKDLNSKLGDILNQINSANTTGRVNGAALKSLIQQRDALLRIKNPTFDSLNYLVKVSPPSPKFPNSIYWNGWGWVNPNPPEQKTCANGTKCRYIVTIQDTSGPPDNIPLNSWTSYTICADCKPSLTLGGSGGTGPGVYQYSGTSNS